MPQEGPRSGEGECEPRLLPASSVDPVAAGGKRATPSREPRITRWKDPGWPRSKEEFEAYLECRRLEYGFPRVKCDACRHEKLVGFSCKRCGFCPSCGARRMAETAAHLVEHVPPNQATRR